jgi:putative transposase
MSRKVHVRFCRRAEGGDPLRLASAVKRIAAYLVCSRQQVYRTLRRWIAEGVTGLDDKPSAPHQPATKVTLRAIATVKELQENPGLGGFRVAAALRRQGIILSPRTCQRILAKNRALYGVPRAATPRREPKPLPFAATRPHEYWCLDIRYLDHRLGDFKVYCLSVMDGYSRAILASMLSRSQDLVPVLLVLYAAIRQWGIPDALVTDSGGVFLANQIQRIYAALGIRKEEIARRQAWQNLLEANFGTQARMADYGFANAASWDELLRVHEQWIDDYNGQMHWAHQHRGDGWRSPQEVLDGAAAAPSPSRPCLGSSTPCASGAS